MTTERDLRLSIELVKARKAWLAEKNLSLDRYVIGSMDFDAGYKAALEDHADCHPADDVDACQDAVKASSRE